MIDYLVGGVPLFSGLWLLGSFAPARTGPACACVFVCGLFIPLAELLPVYMTGLVTHAASRALLLTGIIGLPCVVFLSLLGRAGAYLFQGGHEAPLQQVFVRARHRLRVFLMEWMPPRPGLSAVSAASTHLMFVASIVTLLGCLHFASLRRDTGVGTLAPACVALVLTFYCGVFGFTAGGRWRRLHIIAVVVVCIVGVILVYAAAAKTASIVSQGGYDAVNAGCVRYYVWHDNYGRSWTQNYTDYGCLQDPSGSTNMARAGYVLVTVMPVGWLLWRGAYLAPRIFTMFDANLVRPLVALGCWSLVFIPFAVLLPIALALQVEDSVVARELKLFVGFACLLAIVFVAFASAAFNYQLKRMDGERRAKVAVYNVRKALAAKAVLADADIVRHSFEVYVEQPKTWQAEVASGEWLLWRKVPGFKAQELVYSETLRADELGLMGREDDVARALRTADAAALARRQRRSVLGGLFGTDGPSGGIKITSEKAADRGGAPLASGSAVVDDAEAVDASEAGHGDTVASGGKENTETDQHASREAGDGGTSLNPVGEAAGAIAEPAVDFGTVSAKLIVGPRFSCCGRLGRPAAASRVRDHGVGGRSSRAAAAGRQPAAMVAVVVDNEAVEAAHTNPHGGKSAAVTLSLPPEALDGVAAVSIVQSPTRAYALPTPSPSRPAVPKLAMAGVGGGVSGGPAMTLLVVGESSRVLDDEAQNTGKVREVREFDSSQLAGVVPSDKLSLIKARAAKKKEKSEHKVPEPAALVAPGPPAHDKDKLALVKQGRPRVSAARARAAVAAAGRDRWSALRGAFNSDRPAHEVGWRLVVPPPGFRAQRLRDTLTVVYEKYAHQRTDSSSEVVTTLRRRSLLVVRDACVCACCHR